ncbi:MAG: hypothetical protein L3J37_07375, partial [Rhodobacteraceae bacterium]|nr:hypothetical protein [Paracoccaceae bacterium]
AEVGVEYWQMKTHPLTRVADLEKLKHINDQATREINIQTRKYHRDYERRFEMACKHIARKRGERFDKLKRRADPRSQQLTKLICKAAHDDVENDHRRRLSAIRVRQAKELRDLVEVARDREAGPQAPKLLTDRRKGPERQR